MCIAFWDSGGVTIPHYQAERKLDGSNRTGLAAMCLETKGDRKALKL